MEEKFSGAVDAQDGAGYAGALVHAALHTSLGLHVPYQENQTEAPWCINKFLH